jgi:hypothetical protein
LFAQARAQHSFQQRSTTLPAKFSAKALEHRTSRAAEKLHDDVACLGSALTGKIIDSNLEEVIQSSRATQCDFTLIITLRASFLSECFVTRIAVLTVHWNCYCLADTLAAQTVLLNLLPEHPYLALSVLPQATPLTFFPPSSFDSILRTEPFEFKHTQCVLTACIVMTARQGFAMLFACLTDRYCMTTAYSETSALIAMTVLLILPQ